MYKLALLLLTVAVFNSCFAQNAKKPASPAKSIQTGPLQITAVNTEYAGWQSQLYYPESVAAWGVRVRIENTADKEVSESVSEGDLKVTDASGKQFGISTEYAMLFAEINLNEIRRQGLDGKLFFSNTGGNSVIILSGGAEIGAFSRTVIDTPNIQNVYTITLAPRKFVTLVLLFDSPMGSKPQTLFWPKAKPLDLR